ncbi:MAG: HD domain-containing protein [Oscillospiraceae bacterium]|nr:HD domain-containing protein [Oscillospiraceae bacterium]
MIYTELTIRAMNLAYEAHHGQLDKGGVPYIFHPIHLAEGMDDEISTCVALLHDTVEDTDVTLEELAERFPREIVEAVDLLTHREGVEYFDYVRAIKANPVAVKVKLADLAHNGDPKRISNQGNAEKRRIKYAAVRKILLEEA